jgi:hypothetical protein
MKMSNNKEWLRKMAALEDGCCISVGGLISELKENDPKRSNSEESEREQRRD